MDQVEETAGCCNQDIHPLTEAVYLVNLRYAAINTGGFQTSTGTVGPETLVDLDGKFARRGKYEGPHPTGLPAGRLHHEALEQRKCKSSGLTGPCLRTAEKVLPCKNVGDGSLLNGGRGCVTLTRHGVEKRFDQI